MSTPNIEELRAAAAALAVELDDLSKLESPTEEQTARFEAALDEVDPLDEAIRTAQDAANEARMEKIRALAAKPSHVQSGDGARVAPVPGASNRNIWDVEEAFRSANGSQGAFVSELRSRAATAIEQAKAPDSIPGLTGDDFREQATQRLEQKIHGDRNGDAVARHWLDYGNPEYKEQWTRALKGDLAAAQYCQAKTYEHESRAWAVDGTTTTGGYAIVPDYDVTLLLINAGTVNPFRQIADVRQTVVNKVYGLSTAGVSVGWITESTEEGDDTPAVAQPTWDVQKASGYIEASFETIQDTDLGSEIAFLFNDAKDTLEATAHATGTGSGEPYGVVTRCASLGSLVFGESGSTVEQAIQVGDIYALDNALGPRWRNNASFVANKVIYNQVRQLNNNAALSTFWQDFGGAVPSKLIGYPVFESSAMDSIVASGSLDYVMLLGDFRNGYRIYDRLGAQMAFNPFVVGGSRRPTGNAGWLFYWRTGADVTDQTNASHIKVLRK